MAPGRLHCEDSKQGASQAAIAQLGERQTEDLKVPGSIPGLGTLFGTFIWEATTFNRRAQPPTVWQPQQLSFPSCLQSETGTTRCEH